MLSLSEELKLRFPSTCKACGYLTHKTHGKAAYCDDLCRRIALGRPCKEDLAVREAAKQANYWLMQAWRNE